MRIPWVAVTAVILLAGAIHIIAVLVMPFVATKNAWARLIDRGEDNRLIVLPRASPGQQALPLMSPDVRYAVCRYNLGAGPVRLNLQGLDDLWMIAFYTPRGDNFYTISGGELKRAKVEIVISSRAETLLELEADTSEDADNLVIVKAPQEHGLAVVRAPLRGPSYAAQTDFALRQASCAVKTLPSVVPERPRQR